jgi:hypothetical protein
MSIQGKLFYMHPLTGETHGQFTWCFHCGRVYRTQDLEANEWNCLNQTCRGSALDSFPWFNGNLPRSIHPEYPDFPEIGGYYPL